MRVGLKLTHRAGVFSQQAKGDNVDHAVGIRSTAKCSALFVVDVYLGGRDAAVQYSINSLFSNKAYSMPDQEESLGGETLDGDAKADGALTRQPSSTP
jgi:hypothetical protein